MTAVAFHDGVHNCSIERSSLRAAPKLLPGTLKGAGSMVRIGCVQRRTPQMRCRSLPVAHTQRLSAFAFRVANSRAHDSHAQVFPA